MECGSAHLGAVSPTGTHARSRTDHSTALSIPERGIFRGKSGDDTETGTFRETGHNLELRKRDEERKKENSDDINNNNNARAQLTPAIGTGGGPRLSRSEPARQSLRIAPSKVAGAL